MMKRIVLGLAALAAFQAAAITATKEYVDRSTNALAQAVSQMVPAVDLTPATNYTDAAVSAISNAIPGMVTNEVVTAWSDNWYIAELPEDVDPNRVSLEMTYDQEEIDSGVYGETTWHWKIRFNLEGEDEGDDGHIDEGDRTFGSFQDGSEIVTLDYTFVLRRRPAETRNALGLARITDLTTATNGLIGAAYIATNNPAFVDAVTNCPVTVPGADASEIGAGTYGTIGAIIAALVAAVAALKRGKVTTISAQSTDEQYPSAKCVWNLVGDVESALAAITGTANGGSGT